MTPTLRGEDGLDTETFKKTFEVNVFGSVYVAKYAALKMSKNELYDKKDRGCIIFVSSVAAEEGQRG